MLTPKHKRLKYFFYGLLVSFCLVFINGFFEFGGKSLLVVISLFLISAIVLLIQTLKSTIKGNLKAFLTIASCAAIGYSIGVIYGVLGIWGYYKINDLFFFGAVIISLMCFTVGSLGTIISFRKTEDE